VADQRTPPDTPSLPDGVSSWPRPGSGGGSGADDRALSSARTARTQRSESVRYSRSMSSVMARLRSAWAERGLIGPAPARGRRLGDRAQAAYPVGVPHVRCDELRPGWDGCCALLAVRAPQFRPGQSLIGCTPLAASQSGLVTIVTDSFAQPNARCSMPWSARKMLLTALISAATSVSVATEGKGIGQGRTAAYTHQSVCVRIEVQLRDGRRSQPVSDLGSASRSRLPLAH
jgi:hypothetical protein